MFVELHNALGKLILHTWKEDNYPRLTSGQTDLWPYCLYLLSVADLRKMCEYSSERVFVMMYDFSMSFKKHRFLDFHLLSQWTSTANIIHHITCYELVFVVSVAQHICERFWIVWLAFPCWYLFHLIGGLSNARSTCARFSLTFTSLCSFKRCYQVLERVHIQHNDCL